MSQSDMMINKRNTDFPANVNFRITAWQP